MTCLSWFKSLFLILAFLVVAPLSAFADDFSGEVADVDGKVFITQKATGKTEPAVKGMKLLPGDVVETKAGSELEILYEDGNVTRVGESTKLSIRQLNADADKSRQTVLDLAIGKVKNSVSKLSTVNSKFEVHTKTAVAGVTGTPPWGMIVSGSPESPKVEAYLLPEAGGKTATQGVFVRGVGPQARPVTLTPGTFTRVEFGRPPLPPVYLTPQRISTLAKQMPIHTAPEKQLEKRMEFEKKVDTTAPKKETTAPAKTGSSGGGASDTTGSASGDTKAGSTATTGGTSTSTTSVTGTTTSTGDATGGTSTSTTSVTGATTGGTSTSTTSVAGTTSGVISTGVVGGTATIIDPTAINIPTTVSITTPVPVTATTTSSSTSTMMNHVTNYVSVPPVATFTTSQTVVNTGTQTTSGAVAATTTAGSATAITTTTTSSVAHITLGVTLK